MKTIYIGKDLDLKKIRTGFLMSFQIMSGVFLLTS